MSAVRKSVEEAVIALAAKVIASCEDNRAADAANYASALDDTTRALENLSGSGEEAEE